MFLFIYHDFVENYTNQFMSDCDYEHIVVGGGINGLWAAYHLASRGASVLLLEKVSMTYGREIKMIINGMFFLFHIFLIY